MKERLYEILMNDDVVTSIRENFNELVKIIPEIKSMVNFPHNHPYHHLDVWEHTLYALSFAEKNFLIRLSLLLHDIGKPSTCTTDSDGINHFKGHPIKSYQMAYNILVRLGYNDEIVSKICYLVKYHDDPIHEEDIKIDLELTRLRYSIQYCDSLAHNPNILYKKENYLDKTKILIDKQLAKH